MTVALLGVPFDTASSFLRGAREAPPLIRQALYSDASNLWSETGIDLGATGVLRDEGDLSLVEDAADARRMIEAGAGSLIQPSLRPLFLGGDHSITYPIVRAFAQRFPGLTILHLDAHPDLYDEFQSDRYSHACPMARIMEEGLARRLVQVGIRTINDHQRAQAKRFGVEVIEMKDWVDGRVLDLGSPVYVTLDLDVLEPGLAPGVSHREPGGLSVRQVIDILHRIEGSVVGADVVEMNPHNDPTGLTAQVAAKLVKEIVGVMET